MAEDWRVTATLHEEGSTPRALRALQEHEVTAEVRERLGDRIAVSGEGTRIFLYADTRDAAQRAENVLGEVLSHHGLSADSALDRWHPSRNDGKTAQWRCRGPRRSGGSSISDSRNRRPRIRNGPASRSGKCTVCYLAFGALRDGEV
jgi:hypothetical protein